MLSFFNVSIFATQRHEPIPYEMSIDSTQEQIAHAFSCQEAIEIRSISLEALSRFNEIACYIDWNQRAHKSFALHTHFDIFKEPGEYALFKELLKKLRVTHFQMHLSPDQQCHEQFAFFFDSPHAGFVTTLSIEGCVNNKTADYLIAAISQLKHLKHFKIVSGLSGEKMRTMIETLNPNLESLDITFMNHTDWMQILMTLPAFWHLKKLNFMGSLTYCGMLNFKQILSSRCLPHLETIKLTGYFEEGSLVPLVESMLMKKTIKNLTIVSSHLWSFKPFLRTAFQSEFKIWTNGEQFRAQR